MEESIVPPSPSWFLPNILSCREDGSVSYGCKNDLVILKAVSTKTLDVSVFENAHESRVTSVAFSPGDCTEHFQNTIASCAEDGYVKLWRIDTLSAFIGHRSHWQHQEISGKITCLDWSTANPHQIVSAADNSTLVLWDILSNTTVKFTFQRLIATALACCPHNEKLVAVGVKSGLVNIIHLSGKGDIIYNLRGHDNEIQSLSWCPTPFNIFRNDEIHEEFLLASTCQNKEIYIWRGGSDGKCQIKIPIPTSPMLKKDGSYFGTKLGNTFSFLAVYWHSAYKLFLSSSFGELLLFDIESYLSKASECELKTCKQIQACFKIGHHHHSKGLFAIASKPVNGDIIIYGDDSIKSKLKFKADFHCKITRINNGEKEMKNKWKVDVPESICLLWTASQDRKLIACHLDGSNLDVVFNLSTLNGGVYSLAPSPHDPNKVAIGSGDGLIRLWNLLEPSGEMLIFWQKIKDRVMSLAWNPNKDGQIAYGTSEGRIGLLDTNTNKLPALFKPTHSHAIYALAWGPQLPSNDSKKELGLYSVGDNTLSLYDVSNMGADPINLSKIIPFQSKKQTHVAWKSDYSLMAVGCDDGTIYLVESTDFKIVYTLLAFKKAIYSLAWHPAATSVNSGLSPYHTYLAAGSTDNENVIRVFSCVSAPEAEVRVEQVASLKGHQGHILSTSWSPHVDCRLASTSSDGSVQIWDVSSQIPLANFKPVQKPNLSMWSPIDVDVVLTGCRNGVFCAWKISKQENTQPTAAAAHKAKKGKKGKDNHHMKVAKELSEDDGALSKWTAEEPPVSFAVAEAKNRENGAKEVKIFSKAWKPEAGHDFNKCYFLLKNEKTKDDEDDDDREFSLPFLMEDEKCSGLVALEEKTQKTSKNWPEYYKLALWTGKIKDVIEEKTVSGHLDDFLVSLAPTVSFRFWQETCLAYSKALIEKKMFRKAATYLVACHQIYEAINLLIDENLYLEAMCISRNRLPKSDPVFSEIVRRYAKWLFKTGNFLKACECYAYLGEYLEVAKICGKKDQAEYLSLAALAARKCGSEELEIMEATNALLKCFENKNFDLSRRICQDHDNVKHLKLMFHMYETIHLLDAGELELEVDDVLEHAKKLTGETEIAFPKCLPRLYQPLKMYKNKQEILVVMAQELSLAICSSDREETLGHVINALSTCCRFVQNSQGESDLLFKLCCWLSPKGLLSPEHYFASKEASDSPKMESLREYAIAGIVRHLNLNPSPENISEWIDILYHFKESFLNEESFKYYKNLIDVSICEKKIGFKGNAISECESYEDSEKNGGAEIDSVTTNGNSFPGKTGAGNLENSNGNISSTESATGDHVERLNNGNGESKEKYHAYRGDYIKEEVDREKDALSRLRSEIVNFQNTRISAPNPIPVYSMVKNLCAAIPDSSNARILLSTLDEKWSKLN